MPKFVIAAFHGNELLRFVCEGVTGTEACNNLNQRTPGLEIMSATQVDPVPVWAPAVKVEALEYLKCKG